jgi:soluble lytic murein transglycosylase-like protein
MFSYREVFATVLGLIIAWSATLTGGYTQLNSEGRILGSSIMVPVQEEVAAEPSFDFTVVSRTEVELFQQLERAMQFSTPEESELQILHQKAQAIADHTPLDFETAVILVEYAEAFELNPSLILAIIETESNFNQWEVGTSQDRGLMQIIPSTERWLAKDMGGSIGLKYDPERIFDPEYNIGLAATYLAFLRDSYGDNYNRILSEYNRGPYNLKRYFERNGTYATSYSKKILSREVKYLAFNE